MQRIKYIDQGNIYEEKRKEIEFTIADGYLRLRSDQDLAWDQKDSSQTRIKEFDYDFRNYI